MARSWAELLGEEHAAPEPEEQRGRFFARLRDSLSKSRRALTEQIAATAFDPSSEADWERLEEALIMGDVGVRATAELVQRLEARGEGVADNLNEALAEEVADLFGEPPRLELSQRPTVMLVVGSERGGDPAAVAYDAIEAAQARGRDVVIVDTAGRLHTQANLMEELAKVRRVIAQKLDGAPHETLLVVDATTGQNGLQQARLFGEAAGVTGVVLTKLDGSAKGGVAIPIAYELGLPVKLVGVGEQLDDLRPFDPQDFARALVSG